MQSFFKTSKGLMCFLGLSGCAVFSPCQHSANHFRCVQHVKNYDGDTITFNIPHTHPLIGQNIKVRVDGIDTPEIRGNTPCEKQKALRAKQVVTMLLTRAKTIHLKNVKRGKYFRIVADVVADGVSLGPYLLKHGLAYGYSGQRAKKVMDWCAHPPVPVVEQAP